MGNELSQMNNQRDSSPGRQWSTRIGHQGDSCPASESTRTFISAAFSRESLVVSVGHLPCPSVRLPLMKTQKDQTNYCAGHNCENRPLVGFNGRLGYLLRQIVLDIQSTYSPCSQPDIPWTCMSVDPICILLRFYITSCGQRIATNINTSICINLIWIYSKHGRGN